MHDLLENIDFDYIINVLHEYDLSSEYCVQINGKCYFDRWAFERILLPLYKEDSKICIRIVNVLIDAGILESAKNFGDTLYRISKCQSQ